MRMFGGKDAITEKETADTIKANLDSQSKLKTSTNTGRRVTDGTFLFDRGKAP